VKRAGAVVLGVALAGCAVGPSYERPEISMPDAYAGDYGFADATGQTISGLPWWELFGDPVLVDLIESAIDDNRDLRIAAARVEEAQARLGVVRSDQFPDVGAVAGFERGNQAEVMLPGSGISQVYTAGLSAAYEVDLWGRFRRASEAERAALLASIENQRTVLITLVASVANAYLLVRDLDNQLQIASNTLTARRESTGIIRERFDKGTVALIDVNQAEIEEADAAARKAAMSRQLRGAENLLNLLLGRNPGQILRGAGDTAIVLPVVPAALPAGLLEQRPDIRAAEQQLAEQTARIGVAQSLRFPSISLTASGGYASSELSDLTDGDEIWGVNIDLFAPLFDAGQRRSQVEVEKARTEQLLNNYEQTILAALREVEDALAGIEGFRDELNARRMQVAAAGSAAELSRARYDGGVTDYLEVLDSERSLFNAQLTASAVKRQQLSALVNLYVALGGGWQSAAEPGDESGDQTAADVTPAQ